MGPIPAVASLSAAAVASLNELQLRIQFKFSGSAQLLSFYHQKIPETGPSPPPPPPVLSNKAFFVFVVSSVIRIRQSTSQNADAAAI